MIFVPLPFVVALLLLIRLVAMLRSQEPSKGNRPFLALVGLCALQSVGVGLRWGYDIGELRYVLPVTASCLPPLVLASFRSLIHSDGTEAGGARWIQIMPPLGIVALLLLAPGLVDAALIVLFVGYALALLSLGRSGPDALDEARFADALAAHRALVIAAASLCLSAFFDLAILLDFECSKGTNVALIVSNANLLGLLLLGLTAIVAARAQALPAPATNLAEASSMAAQDRDVLDRIDRLLVDQKLSRDLNLALSRLARRAGSADIRRSQPVRAQERLPINQRHSNRRSLPAAPGDRPVGDRSDARIRVPDEIELQSRVPPGYLAEPGPLAPEKPTVAIACRLTGRQVRNGIETT